MTWKDILKLSNGKDWEVYFFRDDVPENIRRELMMVNGFGQTPLDITPKLFNEYYEHVASVQFDGTEVGPESLFRLTNNVNEEWSKEFAGENDGWNMKIEVSKPLRSSSVLDIFFDKDNNQHWLVHANGFKKVVMDYSTFLERNSERED